MPLTPGTKFGQYEVVEPIGYGNVAAEFGIAAGGVGEVYRAQAMFA